MKKLIPICLLFFTTLAWSQSKSPKLPVTDANFKKYLDDGRADLRKNAVKLHLDGILNTEITGVFERKLSPAWSIEAGLGVIPYYIGLNESVSGAGFVFGDSIMAPKGMGFSYQLMPKYYYTYGGIDQGGYVGLLFKQRLFKNELGNKISYTEVGSMWGMQLLLKKNLCLDLGYGWGVAVYKVDKASINYSTGKPEPLSSFVLAQHLRIGIGMFIGKDPLDDVVGKSRKSKKGDSEDE
jgi:hypothetical protein